MFALKKFIWGPPTRFAVCASNTLSNSIACVKISNVGGIVLNHIYFQFWICCLVPDIFTIKVVSCVKSTQILHDFGPQIISRDSPRIFVPAL